MFWSSGYLEIILLNNLNHNIICVQEQCMKHLDIKNSKKEKINHFYSASCICCFLVFNSLPKVQDVLVHFWPYCFDLLGVRFHSRCYSAPSHSLSLSLCTMSAVLAYTPYFSILNAFLIYLINYESPFILQSCLDSSLVYKIFFAWLTWQ